MNIPKNQVTDEKNPKHDGFILFEYIDDPVNNYYIKALDSVMTFETEMNTHTAKYNDIGANVFISYSNDAVASLEWLVRLTMRTDEEIEEDNIKQKRQQQIFDNMY